MDPEQQHITISPKDQSKMEHILIWIHGLDEQPSKYFKLSASDAFKNFKIILPKAPTRYVTTMQRQAPSWFDIKFRSERSFICPFDEAFSTAEVLESYEKILKPLIHRCKEQLLQLNNPNSKLIVGGFSQGCGMSLHCFYSEPQRVDAVIAVSGYLFPFTPHAPTNRYHRIIYGKNDSLRPWEYVKVTYQGKIQEEKIIILQNTKHQVNSKSAEEIHRAVKQIASIQPNL